MCNKVKKWKIFIKILNEMEEMNIVYTNILSPIYIMQIDSIDCCYTHVNLLRAFQQPRSFHLRAREFLTFPIAFDNIHVY